MEILKINSNFTVDDIHKVREKNYEITKNMTEQEEEIIITNGVWKYIGKYKK